MNTTRGFTLVEFMIVISIIAIIAAIAIPNLIEMRKGANEAAAIGSLKAIVSAQSLFRENDKDHNNTLDYASTISMLGQANLLDPKLGTAVFTDLSGNPWSMKQGYYFGISGGSPNFSGTDYRIGWGAMASPIVQGETGDRIFGVEEDGVIRFSASPSGSFESAPPIGQ